VNGKITELAKECFYFDSSGEAIPTYGNENLEKFAELLINECLEVIEKQYGGGNDDGSEWDRAIDFTYNDVKKYFGIE
jgi:hypothetical protein